ncbi:Uma2 family endonuclease [Limnofasciculus baicalensis]|uniref:Uma2 family endonuclease n=1 Tax=Limnofasciculus baicalensis BBK-W-15 TaxID=2699891 RepID=A0AAE3KRY9_9CYAN|nr:Uma2 family endonuclease [Limnofasciculus baicalensis]MCP2732148.1 Uma2 family endonuclease [Limnofasciculus baicalensis BBK-W-15]
MVTLQLRQIDIPLGQRVLFHQVSWREFEAILEELGEHRAARLAYSKGTLELRMPSPEHEVDKELIGDMVKILLEELEVDCECFGSITFKRETKQGGVEPDQCFYIQNHQIMRGKRRVDLAVNPPPDLAIEIDVTSKTQLEAYEALQIPELWRYERNQLQINILEDGKYLESQISPIFPGLPIIELITESLVQSVSLGRSPTLRLFRNQVRQLNRE